MVGQCCGFCRLPNAPDMEIFSLYGVGIPTERAYVYKLSSSAECYIPFQIDTSADSEDEDGCLKDGVYTVEGDETVPVLSAGFMCARGWRGKTRFNPSGIRTYIREYDHSPPANLLEGRGTQSGAHVDIMGNFALIEDVVRVAAGATGEDLGGDRVFTDIFKWSEKINVQL
jgi:phospholipid:diacylglycerol acyltransferase